jgi:hypothetical protein
MSDDASSNTDDTPRTRRRNRNHNHYIKVVKPRNQQKREELERQKKSEKARRTTKVVRNATAPVYEIGQLAPFVNELFRTKSKKVNCNFDKWKKVMERDIHVYCKCTFPSKRSLTGPQIAGDEIVKDREYIIACKKDRLYEVKKSQIKGANMGLFALRAFKQGEVMGVYFGKIVKDTSKNKDGVNNTSKKNMSKKKATVEKKVILTCYAMEIQQLGMIVDCMGGVDSEHPTYFGLQFANDPTLSEEHDKARGQNRVHNFSVDQNLVARACVDIKPGEELFLYYDSEGEKECKCIGCRVRNADHRFVLE